MIVANSLNLQSESSFAKGADKLGFKDGYDERLKAIAEGEQEALLTIFYLAGYLRAEAIWEDLHNIGGIDDPYATFGEIYQALIQSGATQKNPEKFDAKLLRQKLFGSRFDDQDSMDLILYLAQHAFNRKKGQERNNLVSEDWMVNYSKEYLKAAKTLGLIDRIEPSYESYDFAWIAGKAYAGLLARLVDFFATITKLNIKIKNQILVLTGEHEVYAEKDGISHFVAEKLFDAYGNDIDIDLLDVSLTADQSAETIEEGKKYILDLAQKFGVKLNAEKPFTVYESKADCPLGRRENVHYLNFIPNENNKITESSTAIDLLKKMKQDKNAHVLSAELQKDGSRPTTATTVNTAAQQLVERIKNGDFGDQKCFVILLQSNQPYTQRQTITSQLEVNKILKENGLNKEGYEIIIDGVGFACKEEVPIIHSTLGGLIAEKWAAAALLSTPKRNIKICCFKLVQQKAMYRRFHHMR